MRTTSVLKQIAESEVQAADPRKKDRSPTVVERSRIEVAALAAAA